MKPVDDDVLTRLAELEERSTPAPWARGCLVSARVRVAIAMDQAVGDAILDSVDTGADVELVTLSRDHIAALVAEVMYWRDRQGAGQLPDDLSVTR